MANLAYFSFDTVPAPKGAATHIEAFTQTLASAFGGVDLVTVSAGEAPQGAVERWPGVMHRELPAWGKSLIDRVLCFRHFLTAWMDGRQFDAIHFRSIFEGVPLLQRRGRERLIFEVNGLPSVELKYRYPGVEDDRELMAKIVAQEQACLEAADLVVTPSGVTRQYLTSKRGVAERKVRVIPNGVVKIDDGVRRERADGEFRVLYFGTLSAWQGVELGIRAMAQVCHEFDASLTIIGAGSGRQRDALNALAAKLGIAANVMVLEPLPQTALFERLRDCDAVLAPLTVNDRNVVQGCCPLKILEGMAAAVPVIASDLPVVRELGCDGAHFLLVRPGSVDEIARALARLRSDRQLARQIGARARAHVGANYTWDRSGAALVAAYEELGIKRPMMVRSAPRSQSKLNSETTRSRAAC